jgi:hypothetical protein
MACGNQLLVSVRSSRADDVFKKNAKAKSIEIHGFKNGVTSFSIKKMPRDRCRPSPSNTKSFVVFADFALFVATP